MHQAHGLGNVTQRKSLYFEKTLNFRKPVKRFFMTTIKIKLRHSSVQNRKGHIVYCVTKNSDSRIITTGHKLYPHEWDNAKSEVIPSSDEKLTAIGRHVRHDIRKLERIIRNLDEAKRDYTAGDVVTEYQRVSKSESFFSFMEKVTQRLRQLNHKGTAKNYHATLESFRCFCHNEEVTIEDIDVQLIEDYEAWLRGKDLTLNTVSFYMRVLRAVYNRAVESGLTSPRQPFRTVFTGMERTHKRAVSFEDIKRIHDLELSSMPHLEFARNIFLFLFYCRGMAFVDAAYLKKSNIKCGVLTYRRQKTDQLLHIKVEPEMLEIINRYSIQDSLYLLPIIYPPSDDRKQYDTALHKINNNLKEIGRMVNLEIPLTTYVSRHSWATIAKRKNIPLAVISEALGHDSEATTQIYLSSIDHTTIDMANNLIISGL